MASKRSSLCWSSMYLITLATLWPSFGSSSASATLAKGFLFTIFHSGQSFFMWPCFWHLKHRPSFLSLSFLADHFWLLGFPVEAASISIGTTSLFFCRLRVFWKSLFHLVGLGLPNVSPFFLRDSLITLKCWTSRRAASSQSLMVVGHVSCLRIVARTPYFKPSLNFSMAPTSVHRISPLLRRFSKLEI